MSSVATLLFRAVEARRAQAGWAGDVGRDEIARWLRDESSPPSLDDLASVFGLSFDASGAPHADVSTPPHRLGFIVAVLRDAFPDDGAARRWLRAPDATPGGRRPLDHLLEGNVEQLEELAVREWNRRRSR